jgi:putative flippase GtrA
MANMTSEQGYHARIRELTRYGAVGGSLAVIEYVIYVAIVQRWPQAVLPAYLLSRLVAGVAGFVGHSRYSFGHADLSSRNAVRYALSVLANMALASLILMAMVPLLGAFAAKLASDGVVIVAGYVAGRTLVFTRAPRREAIP